MSTKVWTIRLAVSLILIAIIFSLSMRAKAQRALDPMPMPILELEYGVHLPFVRTHTQLGLGPELVIVMTPISDIIIGE